MQYLDRKGNIEVIINRYLYGFLTNLWGIQAELHIAGSYDPKVSDKSSPTPLDRFVGGWKKSGMIWSCSLAAVTTVVVQNKAAPVNIIFQTTDSTDFSSLLSQN